MGWLTAEELVWQPADGSPGAGRLATHAPSTYKIPTANDCPPELRTAFFDRDNAEDTIHRSKAVGEPPLLLAFSVYFAIRDALSSLGGHRIDPPLPAPATCEAILRAAAAVKRAAAGAAAAAAAAARVGPAGIRCATGAGAALSSTGAALHRRCRWCRRCRWRRWRRRGCRCRRCARRRARTVTDPRRAARDWLDRGVPAVVVEVAEARGSLPRGVGTRMLVAAGATAGTIGGGRLEHRAIAQARARLAAGATAADELRLALGPALGQCCGGAVALRFSALDAAALAAWPAAAPRFHLQLHGAGHVGRAIVRALAPLDAAIDWIDERDEGGLPDAFPPAFEGDAAGGAWPAHVRRLRTDAAEAEVAAAPPGACFLVLTHRHDLDLRIVEAVLARGDFAFLGLIGSRTKKARFVHHLQRRGFAAGAIGRLVCPIGVAGIGGKEPETIALAVAAQLLQVASAQAAQGARTARPDAPPAASPAQP